MSRASRKDRKVQRERVLRAQDRGLPAQASELRKVRRNAPQGTLDRSPAALDASSQAMADQRKGWLSQWPLSMKLLGLATLALLAFGLWRAIASQSGQ